MAAMRGVHWALAAATVALLIAAAYWLTLAPAENSDPCARQADISAAAIADEGIDQQTLVDRAMIERRECERRQSAEPTPAQPSSDP